MMGQNNFSSAQANSNNAYFSDNRQPTDSVAMSPSSQDATVVGLSSDQSRIKRLNPTIFVATIISALVGAGIAVGVMLLIYNKPAVGEAAMEILIEPSAIDNDGTQTIEEGAKKYDEDIAKSTNEEEKFSYTLNKVTYYIINEEYASALAILETIDMQSLDSYDQYRVYNHYASLHSAKGDTAEADRYQRLSDEALSRELENNSAEQPEEQNQQDSEKDDNIEEE